MTPESLPVIFRAERTKDADVTAVFPTLPHDVEGRYFTIYAHIGQHGGGSFDWYHKTRWARPAEYADLLDELKRIYEVSHSPGDPVYRLKVYRRMQPEHWDAFRAEVRRLHQAAAFAPISSSRMTGPSLANCSMTPISHGW